MLKESKAKKVKFFARPNKKSGLSMGLVGMPNAGKTTLYNALTGCNEAAENYAFCTKDPHTGLLKIKDERIEFLSNIYKPKKTTNATLTVVDIAGLIKGSSEGAGLGNEFLEHIKRTDGIFLVVRCFEDVDISHVEVNVDPIRDINIIKEELRKKDIEHIQKQKQKVEKLVRADPHNKKNKENVALCDKMAKCLEKEWLIDCEWTNDEIEFINTCNLLTTKNLTIVANISQRHFTERKGNKHLKAVMDLYKDNMIVLSSVGITEEVKQKIVAKGFESLDLISYFTSGKDEVKSWTIRKGMKAPEAAGVIHTDFEKYFVCAEVMEYDSFKENPSEVKMKAAGKYLQKGKEYVVKDGDILLFKTNVPKGKK
ncbi:OLA1 [Ecytonucleospora hepatopenaei]|uniref:OLA1 n=1 Tax=Ecytonucleospora hepatopenaei TaxID=646526 RepID=A0A1W0E9C4_9MICR|nr:OLA1 [Ecytonucleospora hepatopenaei]